MVTMYSNGITITVHEKEVDRFKRAGYSVVEPAETSAAVTPPAEEADDSAAAEPRRGKK